MKNLYLEKMKTLGLAAVLLLSASAVFGQTRIDWKGTNTNDADDLNNWSPTTNMAGNNVVVGHEGTLANWPNVKYPVTTAPGNLTINSLACANPQPALTAADPITGAPEGTVYGGSSFTIAKPDGAELYSQVNAINYWSGTLIVKSGTFRTRSSFYLEANDSKLIVEGSGIVTIANAFMMGKNAGAANGTGGSVVLKDNAQLNLPGIDRFNDVNTGLSLMTISDNAVVRVAGNRVDYLKNRLFNTMQIRGGEGFVPYVYYNNVPNQTIVVAKSAAIPFVYTTDHMVMSSTERLKANELGKEIAILPNAAILTNAQSIAWKYGTSVDGPFNQVMDGLVTATIQPSFPDLGTYYLVCEVTKEGGDKVMSLPLQYIISTDKVILSPAGKQFLRLGQSTGVVGVVEVGTATSREWKYTTTPGEGYMSFDPVQTGPTMSASFPAIGNYYIVCESTVDGTLLRSKEIEVLVQKGSDGALNITWTGAIDDKMENIYNWNPYAYPAKNNVIVPATAPVWPVFRTGVDTIMGSSNISANAKLYVSGNAIQDTLKLRNDNSLNGELIVEKGIFVKDVSFFRFNSTSSILTVTGTGKAIMNADLLIGNAATPTNGGFVNVKGNGVLVFNNWPGRFPTSASATYGIITISENGMAQFKGDAYNQIASWISLGRIVTVEGYALKYFYDPITQYTYVQARDLAGFSITQTKSEHLGADQLSSELTLSNTSGLTGFEWLYSTSPFGPWESFSTPVVGETAHVSFSTGGTYFVVCKAADGTLSNNVLRVKVYELPISVSGVEGAEVLTVTLPAGATGVEWKNRLEGTTDYLSIAPPVTATTYTPLLEEFEAEGTYEAIYEATVKNDDAQDVVIRSKPVSMVVTAGGIDVITTNVQGVKVENLAIYPNPSTGTFNITTTKGGRVEVLDLKGAVIMSKTVTAGAQPITVSAKGVYLVKVIDGAQVKIGRVVVK